jgi:hypothetical protein
MAYTFHNDVDDFFQREKRLSMKFSRSAARALIERAASEGFAILRYEGGAYRDGLFKASLSAIWDRYRGHYTKEFLEVGNLEAIRSLEEEPEEIDTFIITAKPISELGW